MNIAGKKWGCFAVGVALVYAALRWAFVSASEGIITPDQSVSPSALALGAGTLTLRLVLLFVVLPGSVHWLASALVRRIAAQRH